MFCRGGEKKTENGLEICLRNAFDACYIVHGPEIKVDFGPKAVSQRPGPGCSVGSWTKDEPNCGKSTIQSVDKHSYGHSSSDALMIVANVTGLFAGIISSLETGPSQSTTYSCEVLLCSAIMADRLCRRSRLETGHTQALLYSLAIPASGGNTSS